jgi:hypothetical protein
MKTNEQTKVPYMVESIVGRCHVGESNRRVIRYFISRLKRPAYKTWRTLSRAERKQYMRWIIAAHAANRGLYMHVMGGSQGFTGRTRRKRTKAAEQAK